MITLDKNTIYIDGDWTLANLQGIQAAADKFKSQTLDNTEFTVDGSKLTSLDTIGCQELYIALENLPQTSEIHYQNFDQKKLNLYLFIKSKVLPVKVVSSSIRSTHPIIIKIYYLLF